MRFHSLLVTLFGAFLISPNVYAGNFLLYGSASFGGDTIAEAEVTRDFFSNSSTSTEKVKAGEGLSLAIGYGFDIAKTSNISAQITFGYKFNGIFASNADLEFTRLPLELSIRKTINEKHIWGAGIVHEFKPKYSADIGFIRNIEFDDATGITLYYGYKVTKALEIGGRYTDIEYDVSGIYDGLFNSDSLSANGNNFGIYGSFSF